MYSEKIDFVIPWVDGNDPKWLKERNQYLDEIGDKRKNRFRVHGLQIKKLQHN